jgi:hypothetical protein
MSGVLGIILAGSPKPVQAGGGQVVYDLRGYRYHAFTNAGIPAPGQTTAVGTAGSFTVDSNLSNKLFDVCVISGGGAGAGTSSNMKGAGAGGGSQIADYFNIPITVPPAGPVSYPVYVGVGGALHVPSPGGIPIQYVSRFGASPLGYTAVAGESAVQTDGQPGGASGNGNPGGTGGANFTGGGGGGGAGGVGSSGLTGPPSATSRPAADGGPGGIGASSSIIQPDAPSGNLFGGGGGGGAGKSAGPPGVGFQGNFGIGGPGGGGNGGGAYGPPFIPGPAAGSAGETNTGGGGGGQGAIFSLGPRAAGGPGIVVVRYPYP